MAPHPELIANLAERAYCPYGYGYGGGCYSTWDYYGRWIFAAVAVFVFILILFIWACVNSRRRRKRGVQPMYGTGWMANGQNGQYGHHQQNNPNAYQPPPPAYGAQQGGQAYPMQNQNTGATFRTADGYYAGQQQEGVHKGDYAPPPGPPPVHTRP